MDRLEPIPNQGWDPRLLVAALGELVQVFAVVTRRYLVLVDTLINPSTASSWLDLARAQAVGRELLVVNTHADWDHYWGNQIFRCPILGSRLSLKRVASQEASRELRDKQQAEPERFAAVRLTPPSVTFEGPLVIDGGDLTLELIPTPGHQRDHLAVWIPQISTLLAGDAAELPFPFVDQLAELTRSLELMRHLAPRHAFYCHAPVSAGPRLLEWNLDYFQRVRQRCAAYTGPVPGPDEVEQRVGFPFEEALPPGCQPAALESFYRPGHRAALLAALQGG